MHLFPKKHLEAVPNIGKSLANLVALFFEQHMQKLFSHLYLWMDNMLPIFRPATLHLYPSAECHLYKR